MILYIFLIIGGLVGALVVSAFNLLKTSNRVIDKGESLYSWSTSNGMWFTTRLFIVSLALMFVLPQFIDIDTKGVYSSSNKISNILQTIDAVTIHIKPFNTWTNTDILFIILYVSFLLFIVNIPLNYDITTNGIYYSIFGFQTLSFHAWSEIICYDIENGQIKLWFSPPCFKPDWCINIPIKDCSKVNLILTNYAVHYSVAKNREKKEKIIFKI